jgi:predicted amidophosphoribosyltransferase
LEEYKERKKREQRNEVILLIQKYPEATKKYFFENWGIRKIKIDENDITDDKVEKLLSYKYQYPNDELKLNTSYRIQEEQKKAEEERRRQLERERADSEKRRQQQEKETALSKVRNIVSSWNKAHGIVPIYNLFYYYPKTCNNVYIDSEKQQVRRLIWDFKEGNVSINYKVEKVLKHFFGDNLKHITFVCIPASSARTNNNRYKDFSEKLCKSLLMENGFPYINILHEKQPTHLGGESDNDYFSLDSSFFKGKNVILFDDVITRGDSMVTMRGKLENVGAKVLCGITLGKTVHTDMGANPYDLLFH